MNDENRIHSNEHDEIALLLPWYVNQSLATEEHQRVEQHTRSCLTCRRELKALVDLQAQFRDDDVLALSAQASFQNLPLRSARVSELPRSAKLDVRPHWTRSTRILSWAAAASVVLVVAPALMSRHRALDAPAYQTLSAQSKSATGSLQIVFSPDLAKSRRDVLLQSVGAEPVADSANGVNRVRINSVAFDAVSAAEFLRRQPGVMLAEPVADPSTGAER